MNPIEEMDKDGRIKGVRCLCGKGFTLLARMPMAERERDITKEFASYARKGRRIEMMQCTDRPPFCSCKEISGTTNPPLSVPAKQLSLFAA